MDRSWYIVRTNPRAEKKIGLALTHMGITNYVPLKRTLKKWHDRKRWVDEVLFKSYVFVYIHATEKEIVYDVKGIVQFIFVEGKLATLKEPELERIKIFCGFEDIMVEKGNFKLGDTVEVMEGPLIGATGKLLNTSTGVRLRIEIRSIGCFVTISIEKKHLRLINT
jgi:transcription antitermination factor NusG